jgi:hypothetical protein
MNIKRFVLASLAVFITFEILDFLIHSVILSQIYESLSSIWRQDMISKMWVMLLVTFILSFLFVYIYSKGFGQGLLAGIRFGFIIGLITICASALNQYVVYPVPFNLVFQWCVYGLIQYMICGIVVSLIYKPKS